MREIKFNTAKVFKIALICYAIIFLAGIAFAFIFGVNFDINFRGGTKIAYSYTGKIEAADIEETVKGVIDKEFTVSKSTSIAGDVTTFEISLVGRDALSAETRENLNTALVEKFADNSITIYSETAVNPTIAGTFFAKSMFAVLLTAVLVIIYVGIRFRKIGGVSAAVTALCALILDLLVTFCICIFFRLQIDSNYIAVVLTILGYSLNDTIVVYDRVRENRRFEPDAAIGDVVDKSINAVKIRNFVTTLTTFFAVVTIIVVSELYGLTTLRTFAIPMAFGLISGCVSSLFIAGPLWVKWRNFSDRKKAR